MKSAIVCDFDGTFFGSERKLLRANLLAVQDFVRQGGLFTIATGRMWASIRQFLPSIGIGGDTVVASYQGIMLNRAGDGACLQLKGLDIQLGIKYVNRLHELGFVVQVYLYHDGQDRLFVKQKHEFCDMYAKYTCVEYTAVGEIAQFLQQAEGQLIKVLAFCEEEQKLQKMQQLQSEFCDLDIMSSGKFMIEAITKGGGKHYILDYLQQHCGINKKDVVCIGDEHNDISMIKHCGLGIAVQNAVQSLKDCAHIVYDKSCDQLAVAHIIEDILSGKLG